MSVRGTLGLAALLVALAALLWTLAAERHGGQAGAGTPLLPAASAVETVSLHDGARTLVAIRRDRAWVDAAGRPWPAGVVDDLLAVLRTVGPLVTITAETGQDDFGLGPDAARLRLTGAGQSVVLDLRIGRYNPAMTGFYARIGDADAVVLVGAIVRWELDKVRRAAVRPGSA